MRPYLATPRLEIAYGGLDSEPVTRATSAMNTEFRTRVLELHDVLQKAILEAGASLTVTYSSSQASPDSSTSFTYQSRSTLGVRDTDARSGDEVTVELELENGRYVDLSYPRATLRGIPSDVLAWAVLKDLEGALDRSA